MKIQRRKMKKISKILLTTGTIGAIAAPVAAVVSCGTEKVRHFNILPTYTGQADQLIALGVKADTESTIIKSKAQLLITQFKVSKASSQCHG